RFVLRKHSKEKHVRFYIASLLVLSPFRLVFREVCRSSFAQAVRPPRQSSLETSHRGNAGTNRRFVLCKYSREKYAHFCIATSLVTVSYESVFREVCHSSYGRVV